jgi:hypothetical protein
MHVVALKRYSLAAHGTHAAAESRRSQAAIARPTWSAGHEKHGRFPNAGLYAPTAHAVHSSGAAPATTRPANPGPHWQSYAAPSAARVPIGHGAHPCSRPAYMLPAGQAAHAARSTAPAALTSVAGHSAHDALLGVATTS